LILTDKLVEEARELSGLRRISDLVRAGLEALIEKEARKRLIAYGGTDLGAAAAPRRRSAALEAAEPGEYSSK
jgi:hypothetical protein